MCLLKVKEDQIYSEPVRVRKTKWTSYDSASPPRTAYYSNTRVVEDRRASTVAAPPPPPPPQSYYKETRSEYKQTEAPAPPNVVASDSKYTSRAPSTTSRTRSHYVEVEHDDDSTDSASSAASNDDVRSRTTHRTSKTSNTNTTRRTSKSRTTAPTSAYTEYEREKEIRRERTYSRPRGDDYDTYQYINAPLSGSRSRDYYDPRASSGSYGRRSQQYYR